MSVRTAEEVRVELAEIESELADMVGSPDFTVSGFTADEQKLFDRLMQRKADLELTLGTIAAGGTSEENASNSRSSIPGGW